MILSIILPIFNEEKHLGSFIEAIEGILIPFFGQENFEIICVNDGSQDRTKEILITYKNIFGNIVIIQSEINKGQTYAFYEGFKIARGKFTLTCDADEQYISEDFIELYEKIHNQDLDAVFGYRKNRQDPLYNLIISKIFYYLRKILLSDKSIDSGCSLRIYKTPLIKSVFLWGYMHRFITFFLSEKKYKITNIVVNHKKRIGDKSKYRFSKIFRGSIDLLFIIIMHKRSLFRFLIIVSFIFLFLSKKILILFMLSLFIIIIISLFINKEGLIYYKQNRLGIFG